MVKMKFFAKKKIQKKEKISMRRIIVVCVIIIALIVVLDLYLQRYIDNTFDMMSSMLNDISYNLDNNEDSMKKIENLDETWKNNYTRMACFLEHDELEKINTQITVIKAGIEVEDSEFVHEEVERAIYIVQHIKQKESLKLDNIF